MEKAIRQAGVHVKYSDEPFTETSLVESLREKGMPATDAAAVARGVFKVLPRRR